MKKAYIRTEIIKYLNKVEKNQGRILTSNDIYDKLPELYEYLKSNPENGLEGLDFSKFKELVGLGFMIAQQNYAFGF